MPGYNTKSPSYAELDHWKKQIIEEAMGWAKGVNRITDEKLLEAYEAGLRNGMIKLVATLKFQGALIVGSK